MAKSWPVSRSRLAYSGFLVIWNKIRRKKLNAKNVTVSGSAERFALTRWISVASWLKEGGGILERLENCFCGKSWIDNYYSYLWLFSLIYEYWSLVDVIGPSLIFILYIYEAFHVNCPGAARERQIVLYLAHVYDTKTYFQKFYDKHFRLIFSSAFQWCRQFSRKFPFSPSKSTKRVIS